MGWGFWPGYREKAPRDRQLALYVGRGSQERGWVETEHGERVEITSWEELKLVVSRENLDLYLASISSFDYLDEAMADSRSDVRFSQDGKPSGIVVSSAHDRRKHWIGSMSAWGIKRLEIPELRRLRRLFDYCQAGTRCAPAALGQALQRSSQPQGASGRRNPPELLRRRLAERGVGGRSDTLASPGESFDVAFELDMDSAYLWGCQSLPDGTPVHLDHEATSELVQEDARGRQGSWSSLARSLETWFARCYVCIPDGARMLMGPFPVRGDDQTVSYPNTPGWYGVDDDHQVWLWKEEAELCIEQGMVVMCGDEGFGWTRTTDRLRPWVALMTRLRVNAPADLEPMIKLAIVSGIGWHGQTAVHRSARVLAEGETGQEGDRVVTVGRSELPVLIEEKSRITLPYQTDWYWFDQMVCRVQLYRGVERLRTQDPEVRILATNYDSIVYTQRTKVGVRLRKRDRQEWEQSEAPDTPGMVPLPEFIELRWKMNELHDVSIPYPRALLSREKVRMPGQSRAMA